MGGYSAQFTGGWKDPEFLTETYTVEPGILKGMSSSVTLDYVNNRTIIEFYHNAGVGIGLILNPQAQVKLVHSRYVESGLWPHLRDPEKLRKYH